MTEKIVETVLEDDVCCPHNNITMWISEIHKRGYSRKQKGESMDLNFDSCKEDDLFSADIHCDDCGESLSADETKKILLGIDE